MITVIESIEGAIKKAGGLNKLINPVEFGRQVAKTHDMAANEVDYKRNVRTETAKAKEELLNESDPRMKAKIQRQVAAGYSIDQLAEMKGKERAVLKLTGSMDKTKEMYGRGDESGSSLSDSVKKAQKELKSPSTPGQSLASVIEKAKLGGKAGQQAYAAMNPMGNAIASADAAKEKAGEIKPKDRGVIGWLDDLLTKGNAVSKSIEETAAAIEGKKTEQDRIKSKLADDISLAKDTSGGLDLKRDVSAYARYMDEKKNKGVEFTSSERLSQKMQQAFDDNTEAKLALKAQQAIEKATKESNEKLKTLAKDMGSELRDLLGWGA